MVTEVPLHDLVHQSAYSASNRGNLLKHGHAVGFVFQRLFDPCRLSLDTPDPCQKLSLVLNSVSHWSYPI